MNRNSRLVRSAVLYDVLSSILYAWCVYQAYLYDAKTRTTGILIYLLVYGVFTILVRSPFGVVLMTVLSAFTLPWVFTVPVIREAGSYFDFQPYVGIGVAICVGVIQGLVSVGLMTWGRTFLARRQQFTISAAAAIAFTMLLTLSISLVGVQSYAP